MTPVTRATMLAQIRYHEGLRLRPYRDTKGIWTVGYGHNMEADSTMTGSTRARLHANGCTKAEAAAWLADDVERAVRLLVQHLPWCNGLDEVRQAVMVELCFNMGIGNPPPNARGLRSFVNSLALIRRGDYGAAADNLLRAKWAKDVRSGRANRVAEELRTGRWPTPQVGPAA